MVWTCAHTLCNNDGPSLGWIMGAGVSIYIYIYVCSKDTDDNLTTASCLGNDLRAC